jgi:periplasmic divalent cation tolerance protein
VIKEDSACVVITTCSSEEEANYLASVLVEKRLAACVQILAVNSFFRWEGVVNHSSEKQLLIKTMKSRYAELERLLLEKHSYDCPEIIQLPIEAGSSGYLDWIKSESRP